MEHFNVVDLTRDREILGILQCCENGAADVIRFLHQHGGRKMSWVLLDGVAVEHQLKRRHGNHGRERDAGSPQLHDLLDDHRPDATTRGGSSVLRLGHCGVPRGPVLSSMNTSSSDGVERIQARRGSVREGGGAASSALPSRPETCRLAPKGATLSTPGLAASLSASAGKFAPLTTKVVSAARLRTSSTVPWASNSPSAR